MKRRGNGEGTVLKVGYRNYKAIVVVGWKDEQHPIKKTKQGFHTATEARQYIQQLKEQRTDKRTITDYWQTFSTGEMLSLSDGMQRKYRLAYERLRERGLADKDLHDIHVADLNQAVSDLLGSSAQGIKNLLSKCYQLAMAEEYVGSNLALLMTLPTERNEKPKKPFAKREIDILWSAYGAKKSALLASILLMIYTGMMPVELLNLRTENVQGSIITGVGAKTDKRKTTPIIVPDIALPVLQFLCEQAKDGQIMPMIDKRYREAFKRCMAEHGLSTEHTPYDCRHTTATMYAQLLDPNTLTEVMRHSNLQMTEHYKHNQAEDILKQLNLGIKKERAE